jgi:regulator of sirC expression with transglutaminase-like and TPR domain
MLPDLTDCNNLKKCYAKIYSENVVMGKKSRRKKRLKTGSALPPEVPNAFPAPTRLIKGWQAGILVAVLAFVIFIPALTNDFVTWDDYKFIYDNKGITSLDVDFFKWIFENRRAQWSPLRWLSHAIDYKLWGLNPVGHHLTSIILHALNTFLVVVFVVKLFECSRPTLSPFLSGEDTRHFKRKALVAGIVTALFFAVHPLRVESVAWVSARKDVLYAFFTIASLLFYLRYATETRKKETGIFYLLCLFSFVLAVMSKAMAFTLPFVFVILDMYPLKRINVRSLFENHKALIEKIPFFAISIASIIITIGVHEEIDAVVSLSTSPFLERIPVVFKALSFYLVKTVWPSNLAPFHPYPTEISFLTFEYLGAFILVTAITALCIFLWRRGNSIWITVWAYFVITLLPILGIVRVGAYFAAERYTYMPSIGLFLLIGVGVALLWEKADRKEPVFLLNKKLIISVCVLTIVFLSIITVRQTRVWKDSITLWNHELEIYPKNQFALPNRAKAYAESGDIQNALDDLNRAIRENPLSSLAYIGRAQVYIQVQKYEEAIKDLDNYIKIKPDSPNGYGDRCGAHLQLGNAQQAINDCSRAIELNPKNEVAFNNRGFAHFLSGETDKAINDYSEAISLNPMDPGFYRNRGIAYLKAGKKDESIKDLQKAVKLGDSKTRELLRKIDQ